MARLRKLEKQELDDPKLARFQEYLEEATEIVFSNKTLDGRLLEKVSVSSTAKEVPHKLGRRYEGWWLAGTHENGAHVELTEGTSSDKTKFINLTSSVTATVNIYVY